ncbi:glycosyltransferase family 2 protein, partial [Cryptosporangium minutisporangium]
MTWSVVIPTVGRPSLTACLSGLAASVASADVGGRAGSSAPTEVVLVDDRPLTECGPLPVEIPSSLRVRVVYGCGNGPAAARNAGWRTVGTPWVVFLDDDVVPGPSWAADLAADLADADRRTGAVQGRIEVPLPTDRSPTDAERNTAGLATAAWITADIAYRASALTAVGGFDERFRRAFREDADLALRVQDAGWELVMGRRTTVHPVRIDDAFASVRAQAGNADDVLMTRLHGDEWWERADAPRGRFTRHVVVTAAGMAAVALGLAGRRRAAG